MTDPAVEPPQSLTESAQPWESPPLQVASVPGLALELDDTLRRRRLKVFLYDHPRCECGRRATLALERSGRLVRAVCRTCHP